jgi:hypothetical protein
MMRNKAFLKDLGGGISYTLLLIKRNSPAARRVPLFDFRRGTAMLVVHRYSILAK